MRAKIQYRERILDNIPITGFLHYPHFPFDLAVIWDGKKTYVKPIIAVLAHEGYFTYRGKSFFLKFFRDEDDGTIVPAWALEWVQNRIAKRDFKIDMKLSPVDKIMFDRMVHNKKNTLQEQLSNLDNDY